jgi:hypothetical protein
MDKPHSGLGLVCVLNLVLVMTAAAVVYFGFARSSVGRGEDIRQAALQIKDSILSIFTKPAYSDRQAAVPAIPAVDGVMREGNVPYTSIFAELSAKKQREAFEEDQLIGFMSRIETNIQDGRYEEARNIAQEMEAVVRQKGDDRWYLYFARSVSRLVENAATQSRHEDTLSALQEELGRLKAEREFYRKNLWDVQMAQSFAESALSLQESNAQIQDMLLQILREQYAKSQEALSETRAQLDTGEPLATIEAKERIREGYHEGISEARDLLERSLRIRNRDSRIAFLNEARTRYPPTSAMAKLIDTLLERL